MKIETTLLADITTCVLFICFTASAFAQTDNKNNHFSPIILDHDNYVVPPATDYFMQGANAANVPMPQQGINQSWDYSVLEKNDAFNFSATYQRVNNSMFHNARRQHDFTYMLGGIIALKQTGYEADNNNSFCRAGKSLQLQRFPLQPLTGEESDSLIFNQQDNFDNGNFSFVAYPCTINSSWSNTVRVVTQFRLSVAAFGYDHSPGQFVQIQTLTRTVVGSGKMRIPANAGKTPYMPVLMIKSMLTTIDSIYINDEPAPDVLLAAFGLSQGKKSFENCYTFLRRGIDAPLVTFNMDNSFSSIKSIQYDVKFTDIYCGNKEKLCNNGLPQCVPYSMVTPALLQSDDVTIGHCNDQFTSNGSSSQSIHTTALHSLMAFPNPSHNKFYLRFNNPQKQMISLRISDIAGRVLLQIKTSASNITFGDQLGRGVYFAEVINGNKKETLKLIKL